MLQVKGRLFILGEKVSGLTALMLLNVISRGGSEN